MVVLNEISEGASSTQAPRYDVFLSFRGFDTRLGFTTHLYNALVHAKIATFLDDEDIETGEDLKPELESAIKASRASVVVLSKNYATSSWRLDELVLILERRKTSKHIVVPIFYNVEPTHVRKQQDTFGDAMAKHRQRMEAETDANKRSKLVQKMDQWNNALTKVANLKGKDANDRIEVEFIDEIVKDIIRRLRISSRFPLPQLIGMDDPIKFVTSWLKDTSSHTTNILTILGMGGIGKTSLAKYVFASHSHEFDTSSFIEDINRRCDEKYKGVLDVQKQLYNEFSKRSAFQVYDDSIYTSMIEEAVARKKAFLVLDDIGSLDQLDALLGSKGFHPGSKIIITTKDAWLPESCVLSKSNPKPKHATYKLEGLYETESQKLLCINAFMRNNPKEGYEEVSKELVDYCQGHPMALKVLGRSLHNRDVTYWEGYIDRLKKENDSPISNILRMSFDSLPSENNKELFKHMACIFVGMDREVIVTVLKACGIETRTGITNLVDRCLLSIEWDNLTMHQLVQDMGRFLVRKESLDKPWERSRLWGHESFRVLKQKKGTENVVGLTLDMRMLEKEKSHGSLDLKTEALSKMDRLMLLQLNYVQITDSYKNFPEELRWLCMHGFPLKSLPLDLRMENLVALDMSYSNIESFGIWYSYPQRLHKRLKFQQMIGSCTNNKQLLGSLKILNLSFCKQLRSLGGFEHLLTLERLIVRVCIGLVEVCESVGLCVELVHVDLSYCKKLRKLPRSIGMLNKVKTLLLKGCSLGETPIKIGAIPSDLKFFTISLPRSLVELSLENNNLSNESFPMDFSCLSMLKKLCLDENSIVSLPNCVTTLPRLENLTMSNCKMLASVEHPPHTLTVLGLYFDFHNPSLRKVVFDTQMSLLQLFTGYEMFAHSSFEFEGVVKIQPMTGVEEKLLCSLGWTKLDILNKRRLRTYNIFGQSEESEIQMYYEFGIFSTIYGGEEMPNWITDRSMGPSISFTIPSSPNNLKGLNFCYVQMALNVKSINLPMIKISNITKNLTWIYRHYIDKVSVGEECFTFLSHWMFGMNEMECGDNISVTVWLGAYNESYGIAVTKECGVDIMYDNGDKDEEEEDALSYYKSWNHILGGDLTGFQLTTGEYILHTWNLTRVGNEVDEDYNELVRDDANFKEKDMWFKALSPKKCGIRGDARDMRI